MLKIDDDSYPQNLQVYRLFSSPSYKMCFPLFGPAGCRGQEFAVRLRMLEAECPQHSQYTFPVMVHSPKKGTVTPLSLRNPNA